MDVEQRAVMLAAVKKVLASEDIAARAQIAGAMNPGDRRSIRAGTAKLGTITMTDPMPKATVVDEDMFTAEAVRLQPEAVTRRVALRDGVELEDIVELLRAVEQAAGDLQLGELFCTDVSVPDFLRKELLDMAAGGEPIAGVLVGSTSSVLQVRLDRSGAAENLARQLLGSSMPELEVGAA